MDSLITVMNKLYDGFLTVDIETQMVDLPQIVVVGSQSSGKSSILESLVGKSILPRGIGIVTRVPLVLHIINQSEFEHKFSEPTIYTQDWATFLHKPNVVFNDFGKVRKEIESRTKELAGNKKNISDEPIVLNVYSRCMYNLSFVDLPGLTKGSTEGQPPDIETKIRDLILHFIKNPNSIILAVVTADSDPTTSESLHIAKSVDPNGDRTIVVVTKIDTMIASTDANSFLYAKVIQIQLGIIGVINRPQKDEQKTIIQSLEAEKKYFEKMYPTVADKQGTIVLGKRLAYQFLKKIKETYPGLKKKLSDMHTTYYLQLSQLQEYKINYDRFLLDLLTQIGASFVARLDGQLNYRSLKKPNQGFEIMDYYETIFMKVIDEIDPLYNVSSDDIISVIKNTLGPSGTVMGEFMPAIAFDIIVKKQLRQLEAPSLNCISYVHKKLISTAFNIEIDFSHELKMYPKLEEKIIKLLLTLLEEYKIKADDAVTRMINCQEALVNTNHPEFIKDVVMSDKYLAIIKVIVRDECSMQNIHKEIRKEWKKIANSVFSTFSLTNDMQSRAELLNFFIKRYFNVVKTTVQDIVPKIIMYEMINNIKINFPMELISRFYNSNDPNMRVWMLESTEIIGQKLRASRQRYYATVEAYKLMVEIEQLSV